MAQPHPPPRPPPRIPEHIVDPPTLRLALASLFVLVQAYKLADALWPQSAQPPPLATDDALLPSFNWALAKWLLADAGTVALVSFLRVPRLEWGWKARWNIRLALWLSDWLLFGRWTFTASYLLPVAVKGLVTRALSTDERKVRLASVVGSDKSHLGGQFTVRILAVSTAMLNPLSTIYCRHASSSSRSLLPGHHHKADRTLIPLVFNNTIPAKVTYTLTSFDDPPTSHQVTVPASSLVRHAHPSHHRNRGDPSSSSSSSTQNNLDDELALASEWALVPASSSSNSQGASAKGSSPQHALRHRLPSDGPAAASAPDASDPFGLAPSESLYYLPISSLGLVRLDSVVDKDGHSVRIRRKRAVTAAPASSSSSAPASANAASADQGAVALAFEEVRIVRCPSAGFDLGATGSADEEHRCLVPNAGLPESWPLGLAVSGSEPLSVRWHARVGDPQRGVRKDETLDGIVGAGGDGGDGVVPVPMNVSLAQAGRTTYYLDAVVDAYGNEVTYDLARSSSSSPDGTTKDKVPSGSRNKALPHLVPGTVARRSVVVHRPPEVAFVGECAKGDDVHLLEGGRKKLQLRLQGVDDDLRAGDGAFDVQVRFSPAAQGVKGWTRLVKTQTARAEVEVDQAGTYEVVGVKSKHCNGAVLVPNTCTLVVQPRPTLSTTFTPIHDVCNAETGAVASLHLTGAPPFVVHYSIAQLDASGTRVVRTSRKQRRVQHSRDEVRLEAPGPGRWEYRFTRVDDRFYQGVVDLPEGGAGAQAYRHEVAEVGDARWRNAKEGKTVHSCEGETVQVEIELQGTAPWDIEYSVVGQSAQAIKGITKSPYTLEVDIPEHIAQQGGQFALSLESVRDAHGCKRPLTGSDLNVEVRRTKPTARFHRAEGVRIVTLRDDDTARIPLRLTGEGPWTITYQSPPARDGKLPAPSTFSTKDANGEIAVRRPRAGTYRLVAVRDQFCPGDVAETEWTVKTLPRPTLRLDERAGKVSRGGSVVRRGVCANAVDSIPVLFEGKAPFKASYTLQKGSHHGDTRSHHLQAIQSRADLTLFTASPGHHTYTFTGVGDSLYTSPDAAGLEAPVGGKDGVVRVEQDVWALPTAGFAHGARHGFCVHDKLASRGHDDLVLRLEGQAPFEVELEVREDGHRASKRFTVPAIQGHDWPVSLPYGLNTAAPHSILLRRVKDAHGCETLIDPSSSSSSSTAAGAGALKASVSIPVAEIATITPVSAQVDHCVGDALEFIVQGSPPFTVKYEFEGKQHAVAHSSGTFQRLAAAPGTFKILSVGHGEDQCRSNQVDIVKHVHPIPSARVQTGDSYVVDIREGEQTEIKFSFSGTPPFAFTYARRAPQDRSKDRTVLEQHTVTGIKEHEYSIFTAQEGTWSVSYISDAFCSYPPPSSPPAQRSAVVKA